MHGMDKINNEYFTQLVLFFEHPLFTSPTTWIDNFAKLNIILTLNIQFVKLKFKYTFIRLNLLLTNFVKSKHLCK
jgi:hypothetical protein